MESKTPSLKNFAKCLLGSSQKYKAFVRKRTKALYFLYLKRIMLILLALQGAAELVLKSELQELEQLH